MYTNPDPAIFERLLNGSLLPPPAGASTLSDDSAERKNVPVATGAFDYFPDAFVAIAILSKIGNDKHNPGEPLHWARGKGGDNANELLRHFAQRGTFDVDGILHSVKVLWRAAAIAQLELETLYLMAHPEEMRSPGPIAPPRMDDQTMSLRHATVEDAHVCSLCGTRYASPDTARTCCLRPKVGPESEDASRDVLTRLRCGERI